MHAYKCATVQLCMLVSVQACSSDCILAPRVLRAPRRGLGSSLCTLCVTARSYPIAAFPGGANKLLNELFITATHPQLLWGERDGGDTMAPPRSPVPLAG